jgi:tetratricopeptide (TPR) repeat protein
MRQEPARAEILPEKLPPQEAPPPVRVANAPSSTVIVPTPISSSEPAVQLEGATAAQKQPPLARPDMIWEEAKKRGNVEEITRFAYNYSGTPEGALAEQWLEDLIETTDDVERLEALRAEASGTLALKAQFRIERLAAEKLVAERDIITAALPDEQEETEAPQPSSPPAAIIAVTPTPAQPQDGPPDPAATITPRDPKVHIKKGLAALKAGNHDQAISAFDKAILLEPGNAKTYLQRASVWEGKGDLEKALADCDAAINIDGSSIAALQARGMLWRRKGDFVRALADLDRAIRLSFSDAKAYRDRGLIWYDMGHYNRAIADFSRAITIDPNLASAYVNRGKAFQKKGDPLTATINFEKAVQRDPSLGRSRELIQARSDNEDLSRRAPQIAR